MAGRQRGMMNEQLQLKRTNPREPEQRSAVSRGGVSIRRMQPEDAETCGRIGFEAHGAVATAHNVPSEQPSVELAVGLISKLLADPQAQGFVAEQDGRIV